MNETLKSDLKHYLESIDDSRKSKGKIYPLYQLLVCLFYGVFYGYDNSSDIEDFVDVNFDYFNKTFSLKDVPSHVTFSRIMRMLDVKTLASALSVFLAEKYPEKYAEYGGKKVKF